MLRAIATAALLVCALALPGAETMAPDRIDELVGMFDPNTQVDIQNAFTSPASDVSKEVQDATWFASIMFAPFLVLPIVLLIYVVFKFRDRGDGRQPATFIHNDKLEIFWTAIPILVVVIVSIPMTRLIFYTDLPPEDEDVRDPLKVEVIGQQFLWNYSYPEYGVQMGWADERQQPVVLQKDRLTTLYFTSRDVNHAWAVPAFGVKKDCFPAPRYNYAWFTPNRVGFYDGQCYELCGENHGKMVLSAVVAEEDDFLAWIDFQRHALDARDVAAVVRETDEDAGVQQSLMDAVKTYLDAGHSPARINALLYWVAYSYNIAAGDLEIAGEDAEAAKVRQTEEEQRAVLRNLISVNLERIRSQPEPAAQPETNDDAAEAPAAEPATAAQEG